MDGTKVRYTDGRFISKRPSNAARKIFAKAYAHLKASGPLSLKITLRETTRNSSNKEFSYKVRHIKEHKEVVLNNKTIVYNYVTKVKAIK
jgi:hypothetical protein